ncbi:MAG TPA: anthrone oxygenase family protein [Acidimicrobiales bacterium]
MIDGYLFPLTVIAALGCGLIAGVFYAFSVMVMRSLAQLPAEHGVTAMQAINVAALRPVFLWVFTGTAAVCAAVVVGSLVDWDDASPYLVVGGLLYLVGSFGLTVGYHVPRNESLDRVEPTSPDAARYWSRYVREWTMGNHVRGAASLAAAALLTIALHVT